MLFFVHDGAMELTLNGTPAIAGAGQIVLFDCREPYSYAASDGLEFTWLLFNGLNARAFYQKILQARGRRAFSPAAPAEIAQMLDSLRSACAEDARLSEARCSQLIHRLLCLLLLDETTESTAGGDRIAQAIRYMNRHLFEPIGVQDAAAAVSLSPSHFSRQFRREPAIRHMSISCCAASIRRSICWPLPNCRSRKSPTRPATTARRISFTASARTLALHPESFGSIRSNRLTSAKNADKIKQSSSRSA